jgi:hypothetical protein
VAPQQIASSDSGHGRFRDHGNLDLEAEFQPVNEYGIHGSHPHADIVPDHMLSLRFANTARS